MTKKDDIEVTFTAGGKSVKTTAEKMDQAADAIRGIGDNSGDTSDIRGVSGARLKSFIERVERLEEEKKAIAEDVKDVYGEANATGFDPKIMRKLVRVRKTILEKRREEAELLSLYAAAIQFDLGF